MTRTIATSSPLATVGRPRRAAATALALALILALLPTSGPSGPLARVVIQATASLADATAALTASGGRVVGQLPAFGLLIGEVPAARLRTVDADPRTGPITPDVPLQLQSSGFAAAAAATGETSPMLATIGAPEAWAAGIDGSGVGVALVDTGVAGHPDLAGRVTAVIDVSGEGSRSDGHGHGTFLAGLVAGSGESSGGTNAGVAPGAHLVSIKVADAAGRTSLSRVLAGLEAAGVTADELGVRVVVLALSGPVGEGRDPLQLALEMLWANGLVVVVPAGNLGPEAGSITSPGIDPYVVTAGASADAGTHDPADDRIPSWSSVGPAPDGTAKPELVAPGDAITGLRVAGSVVDVAYPDAVVDDHYVRGSGTSMSAAVVAGAAALLLDAEPTLGPDEVKGRLMDGAAPAPSGAVSAAVGAGVLNVPAALASDAPPANADLPPIGPGAQRRGSDRGRGQAAVPAGASHRGAAPAGLHDVPDAPSAWRFEDGVWSAWNWSAWNWSAWNWSAWNWSAWNWSAWNWSAWNWSAWNWSAWNWR